MTLIAAWKEQDTPFLIGDFLISIQGAKGLQHIPIPTRDDLDMLLPNNQKQNVVDLCQKAYSISPNLAVACAGNKWIARRIVTRLQKTFGDNTPSLNEVREYFESLKSFKIRKPSCVILGWVIEDTEAHCFRWRSDSPDCFENGDMFIDGSGAEDFKDAFAPHFQIGNDPIENALARVANILKDEVLYGTSLLSLFGGGFEFAYFRGNEFAIIPTITFIFLQIEEPKEQGFLELLIPRKVLKYYYDGRLVQVLAVNIGENGLSLNKENPPAVSAHQMFYVPPINTPSGTSFTVNSNLSLVSQYYCICIDVLLRDKLKGPKGGKNIIQTLVFSVTDEKKDAFLEISDEGDSEWLTLQPALFKKIQVVLDNIDRNKLKPILGKRQRKKQ